MRSCIVYRGPSAIDGAPILGVLTGLDGSSENPKTGPMAQLWILRADMAPIEARRRGADVSICGECALRGAGCYVNLGQAPTAVFRAVERGAYPERAWRGRVLSPMVVARLQDIALRVGAYGEPTALPYRLVRSLVDASAGWTGYTHRWASPDVRPAWRSILMASCDTELDAEVARRWGWRTFRVDHHGRESLPGEVQCPAVTHRVQCADCRLCAGNLGGKAIKSVWIAPHGGAASLRAAAKAAREGRFTPVSIRGRVL